MTGVAVFRGLVDDSYSPFVVVVVGRTGVLTLGLVVPRSGMSFM